jgi:puromycin-sensitive aminopeptidase
VTEQNPYRLTRVWAPTHYDLTLRVDPAEDPYSGRVRIEATVEEPTAMLEIHAVDLTITEALATTTSGSIVLTPNPRTEHGVVELRASQPISAGPTTLELAFQGQLRRDLEGLYLSTYRDEEGVEHRIATTQFESTGARKAFPCFDEPDAKATFAVTLEVPASLEAFSNYPELERTLLADGFERRRFQTTMRMSTYLLAIVVGRFEATEPVLYRDEVPLRVVHVPGKGHLARFAIDVALHALAFYEDYFAIPYPAPKVDLLAIPDFAAGAMENLGAITFRETALLVDEERAAQVDLERVADVVCHELAHMWFGDLVTMRWWNGIWLNEAFATFMEVTAVDAYHPEWRHWETFAISRLAAMGIDALPSTRPIEYTVLAPEDAEDMFDLLTYEKGASILRMISQFMGPERFRDGVRRYLTQHAYDNAETQDLWEALATVAEHDIAAILNTWVFQGGHPMISVEPLPDGVRLAQSPFRLLAGEDDPIGAIGSLWYVPIAVRSLADGERTILLDQPETSLDLGPAPVVVNAHGEGVFRTRYAQSLLAQLVEAFPRLETLERFNLVADTWALVQAGHAPLEDFVALARRLSAERDPNILGVAAGAIGLLERIAEPDEVHHVRRLAAEVFSPVLEDLGMEPGDDESPQLRLARATAYDVLGDIAEDPEVREHARERFREEMSGVGGPPGDLAAAVLGIVARFGDESDFAFILDRYRHPRDPQDEQRHLMALAEFRQPALGRRVLELAMSEVRTQDAPFLINRALANSALQDLTLDVLFARFDEMLARFPTNTIDRMLQSLALVVGPKTYQRADEIFRFFEAHPIPAGKRVLAQTLERYQVNLRLRARLAGHLASQLA